MCEHCDAMKEIYTAMQKFKIEHTERENQNIAFEKIMEMSEHTEELAKTFLNECEKAGIHPALAAAFSMQTEKQAIMFAYNHIMNQQNQHNLDAHIHSGVLVC